MLGVFTNTIKGFTAQADGKLVCDKCHEAGRGNPMARSSTRNHLKTAAHGLALQALEVRNIIAPTPAVQEDIWEVSDPMGVPEGPPPLGGNTNRKSRQSALIAELQRIQAPSQISFGVTQMSTKDRLEQQLRRQPLNVVDRLVRSMDETRDMQRWLQEEDNDQDDVLNAVLNEYQEEYGEPVLACH
jgi:hypothetical protein